ncbi:hypothetical protein DPSP01_000786 [Paraphaeosphaeria sporulosa]|uniref:Mid2 domain-containing protein n=1 Tax=Paraphaeosphaeria sporulosa TaxID=1460663 RepID=A0A177CRZ5_9PLEO|nr:uncharacterized protein CC84DRAFT_440589 [Paraphaeosphaeria sporulosa]OAG09539.1 hypothetical protein CC84DRAFT_440589 [Paraphaeosphaeria sporulosa]
MATCYGRDGRPDPKFLPCNQTAILEQKHTSCCKEDERCFTNGLCRHKALGTDTNYYWLEACTDPTFKDPACPPWDPCRHADNLYWKCLDSKAWCCNNGGPSEVQMRTGHINTTCCNMTEFMFQAADPVVYATAVQMRLPISTLLSSSETALDQSSISTSTSAPATSVQPTTSTPSITTPIIDGSSQQNLTSSSSGSSNNIKVGVGVGVGLGVCVVALSAVLFVMLKRKRPQRNELKGHKIAEMHSQSAMYELHGNEVTAEVMSEKTRYEMRA